MFVCNTVNAFVLLKRDKHSQDHKQWKLQFPLSPAINIQHELCPTLSHYYAGKNLKIAQFKEYSQSGHRNYPTQGLQLAADCKSLLKTLQWEFCAALKFLTVAQTRASSTKDENPPISHTFIWLFYNRISPCNWDPLVLLILEPHLEPSKGLREFFHLGVSIWLILRLYCHLSNEENNLFAHILGCFPTVAAHMLPFSAFLLKESLKRKNPVIFTPSWRSGHLMSNLPSAQPKSGHCYTELG